jgi:hypothetical protein
MRGPNSREPIEYRRSQYRLLPATRQPMKITTLRLNQVPFTPGILPREEESEYWSYIYAGKMMSILKLQARLFLKRQAALGISNHCGPEWRRRFTR